MDPVISSALSGPAPELDAFLTKALEAQWLSPQDLGAYENLTIRSPGSLFNPNSHRPLTAAFFGGTGVGKSSLLNQLAGQDIARTGIERPTSREVSIYLHESVEFQQLPNDLPVDDVRMARHSNESKRQILWIDMPDIDSVDSANRNIVLQWLPHLDVVIYVVSPERYRDDKGWRLLKEYGGDHAWIFVLNQWDRGEQVQFEDFRRLLTEAGFSDPIVLRTIARATSEAQSSTSELHELERVLGEISSQHLMAQLEAHAGIARLDALREVLVQFDTALGGNEDYVHLAPRWQEIWSEAVHDLMEGMEWTLIALVRMLSGRMTDKVTDGVSQESPASPQAMPVIWDEWAAGRAQDTLAQLLVAAGERGLPPRPLKLALSPFIEVTGQKVIQRGQLKLRQALALPGNALQRTAMRVAGFLSILLPSLALAWASYQVVIGYYESATHHLDYLGTDFAVHTLLLIGLAWLAPWFVYSRLRPSVEASALRGLRSGVREALEAAGEGVVATLASTALSHREMIDALHGIQANVEREATLADRDYAPLVRRMIARGVTPPENPN
ncbi:MAG TPA: GTP-binding protein [Methylococcaceae bacterium]|nr:GTP-binding protein [Methylococcaceae bacterium]